ncbi:MAG: hypothetical protein PUD93_11510 [Lachnospiraceae bacterium]|nr:hypothetical protein [Lachnospiraceae bacterium]
MKTTLKLEQKIETALQEECRNIGVSEELKQKIDRAIEQKQEEKTMKHFSTKKVVIGVAAACLLVSSMAFAGKTVALRSGTNLMDMYTSYDQMREAEEKLGSDVNYVEKFANGYYFERASVDPTEAVDEAGNVLYSYQDMMIHYIKGGAPSISLSICKPVEEFENTKTPNATRDCDGITLRYDVYTYKFVPVDYELTEEDMENEKRDDYYISYGSSEVEIQQAHNVTWEMDGMHYNLFGFDVELTPDEMMDMAEEIIHAK